MHPLLKCPLQKLTSFWFLALFVLGFSQAGHGAYRVYKLRVVSYNERNRPSTQSAVLTTLDPNQYQNYHSGYGRMEVQLVDTWYCPGDTSFKRYCSKPKDRRLQRGLASEFAPKRDALPSNLAPVIP